MKKLLPVVFLMLMMSVSAQTGFAQKQGQQLIDSLLRELPGAKNDTAKVSLLNSLSLNYQCIHAQKRLEYGSKALQLAQKLHWEKGIAAAQCNIAAYYNTHGKADTAMMYGNAALVLGKKLGDNAIIAGSLMNTGLARFNLSDYPQAVESYQQALSYARKAGDELLQAWIQLYIGQAYVFMGAYDTAQICFRNTLDAGRRLGNYGLSAATLNNLAIAYYNQSAYFRSVQIVRQSLVLCRQYGLQELEAAAYQNLGNAFFALSDYTKAIDMLLHSLKLCEATGNQSYAAFTLMTIGVVYSSLSDYPNAIEYYRQASKISEQLGNKLLVANCINNTGDSYEHLADYPQALEWYKKALQIYKTIADKTYQALACYNVAHIYYYLSDYSLSLFYVKQAQDLSRESHSRFIASCTLSLFSELCLHAPDSVLAKMMVRPGEKYRYALAYADSSLHYANETGSMEDMIPAWKLLSEIHREQGHYEKALDAYHNYITLRDSAMGEETKKQITRRQMQFDFDKKQLSDSLNHADEKRLSDLKFQKQKTYTYAGFAGIAMLLLLSFFIFKNYNIQKRSNQMLSVEKRKSENLLLNILPSEVAEELKENGYAEARQFDDVTVIFTDFVNFTQTAEQLSPQALVQELHECFTAFDNIIERNGLEKIKTVGDAYLAVCGLPTADPNHAQKTVQAALYIRDFIAERKNQKKVFEIRIGIHSGSVVAGIVGVKKFAYDIWGDTVNTAARMEQSGEAGKINISETTHELVKDDFECAYRGKITAKGKGEIDMYFVN